MYGYLYYPLSEVNEHEHLGYFLLSQRLRGCIASILIIREGARNSNHSSTISETAPR